MTRHLKWLIPLLLAPLSFFGCAWVAQLTIANSDGNLNTQPSFGLTVVVVASIMLPVFFVLWAAVAGLRLVREATRLRIESRAADGPQTNAQPARSYASSAESYLTPERNQIRAERRDAEAETTSTHSAADEDIAEPEPFVYLSQEPSTDPQITTLTALSDASSLLALLQVDLEPAPIEIIGRESIEGDPEEVFHYETTLFHSRFTGNVFTDGNQEDDDSAFPAFVRAGLTVGDAHSPAAIDALHLSDAERGLIGGWRQPQPVRVIVTDERVLCLVEGEWTSIRFDDMAVLYPSPERRGFIAEMRTDLPVLLSGPTAPILAVWVIYLTQGAEWLWEDASLDMLRGK
ncbi:hypothetical protein GCM10022198_06970 [Klugiella xanthotipulae]|uniref:Uncharacterized protein n=1 Tax=Klugiella xanthotipulae TaxID=244735 RepID=A0A543HTA3_9MICO|nr:hypothetical protein [Klugiella xanthotipulae]TQM61538.1 hypothetical protein FB466_2494 [Klugiella xanthotipulae]